MQGFCQLFSFCTCIFNISDANYGSLRQKEPWFAQKSAIDHGNGQHQALLKKLTHFVTL